jgi:hypothetical protein
MFRFAIVIKSLINIILCLSGILAVVIACDVALHHAACRFFAGWSAFLLCSPSPLLDYMSTIHSFTVLSSSVAGLAAIVALCAPPWTRRHRRPEPTTHHGEPQ